MTHCRMISPRSLGLSLAEMSAIALLSAQMVTSHPYIGQLPHPYMGQLPPVADRNSSSLFPLEISWLHTNRAGNCNHCTRLAAKETWSYQMSRDALNVRRSKGARLSAVAIRAAAFLTRLSISSAESSISWSPLSVIPSVLASLILEATSPPSLVLQQRPEACLSC